MICVLKKVFVVAALGLILTSCSFGVKNEYEDFSETKTADEYKSEITYIANKNTKKFHCVNCKMVEMMNDNNKIYLYGDYQNAVDDGYSPCAKCNPN